MLFFLKQPTLLPQIQRFRKNPSIFTEGRFSSFSPEGKRIFLILSILRCWKDVCTAFWLIRSRLSTRILASNANRDTLRSV